MGRPHGLGSPERHRVHRAARRKVVLLPTWPSQQHPRTQRRQAVSQGSTRHRSKILPLSALPSVVEVITVSGSQLPMSMRGAIGAMPWIILWSLDSSRAGGQGHA